MSFERSGDLRCQLAECEARVASLMWVLGVVRRGVGWSEDSPILRLIDRTMNHESARDASAPLGTNVTRMAASRARPPYQERMASD
jgi:hypothetical protein